MISVVDVAVQAANPQAPLWPMRSFINSPSSIRVRNVPKKIGSWQITQVYFTATYPDGSIKTAQCVLNGCVWVGTIEGSPRSGTSENGYTIFANGIDEHGEPVNGYVLGKGDILIMQADGTITPDAPSYYVHLLSAQSDEPKEGDLWQNDGTYYIWQNGQAWPIGDDSGLIDELSAKIENKADLSNVLNLSSDEGQTVVQIPNFSNGVMINNYTMEANDTGVIAPKHFVESYVNNAIVNKADLSTLDSKADLSALDNKADLSAVLNLSGDTQMVLQRPAFTNGIYLDGLELRGTESGAVATIQYVDSIVGDVEAILSAM